MNLPDYIVLGGLVIITVCIVIWLIRRKKQGRNSCGGCVYRDNCVEKSCKK